MNKSILLFLCLLTLSGHSIYHLHSQWKTQESKTVILGAFKGKIAVLSMVYLSCEYVCPRIISDMKALEQKIGEKDKDQVRFVLVSIDPARDTPRVMDQYAKKRDLDPKYWTLLHGKEDNIRELAAVLGVQYQKVSETDFTHSNLITLLNREGEIAFQQKGLGTKQEEMVRQIQKLLH